MNTHPEQWAAMLQRPGSSWGFGVLLKDTSVVVLKEERALVIHCPTNNPCRTWDSNPQPLDYKPRLPPFSLQVVKTAPDSQLLNLLSVSRLVTVLDKANDYSVICKLQELDRGVLWSAVIRVEGEEQWGENATLRGASASSFFPVFLSKFLKDYFI